MMLVNGRKYNGKEALEFASLMSGSQTSGSGVNLECHWRH